MLVGRDKNAGREFRSLGATLPVKILFASPLTRCQVECCLLVVLPVQFHREDEEKSVPALRAVLFDLDGVLVDTCEAWFRLVNLAARHFCKPDVSRDRFEQSWGQGIEADLRDFFPGCTAAAVQRFYEQHLLDFDGCMLLQDGSRDVLARLHDAGILRGVVTNTPTGLARDLLAWSGLIGLVDVTVGAGPTTAAKPAPDVVLQACRDLELEPRQVLMIGDSQCDAEAAAAAAVRFLGFRTERPPAVQDLREILALVGAGSGS